MNKARISLIIFNVVTWAVLAGLLIAGLRNHYVYSFGILVLMITITVMAPWKERTTIKAEGGFLGEDNEISEEVVHELAEHAGEDAGGQVG